MNINQSGLDIIKEFEGLRLRAYKDSVGVLTIGYGHTSRAGLPKVISNMEITEDQAEDILRNDLGIFEKGVESVIGVKMDSLSENQFSALVSLAYNIGIPALRNSSIAVFIRLGNLEEAGKHILYWNKAGGRILPGLVRRRKAEYDLYNS